MFLFCFGTLDVQSVCHHVFISSYSVVFFSPQVLFISFSPITYYPLSSSSACPLFVALFLGTGMNIVTHCYSLCVLIRIVLN